MNEKVSLMPHNRSIVTEIKQALKEDINDICIVQGTGGGKSFVLMAMLAEIFEHNKTLIVTPTISVQENMKLYKEFPEVAKNAEFKTYNYFSDKNKVEEVLTDYDVVIVDEAHHLGSDLYGRNLRLLQNKIKQQKDKYFFGLTATPVRSADNVDVRKYFTRDINGFSAFEFIEQGLMPQIEYLACEPDKTEALIQSGEYKEILDFNSSKELLSSIVNDNPKNKWLCYFSTITDLKKYRELIEELFPNYKILQVYSGSKDSIADLKDIKKEEKVVIMSVSQILEGVHLDKMEGILLFRNVRSLNVFEQILGRVLSIGAKTMPLFVDCTNTGATLLKKLINKNEADKKEIKSDNWQYRKTHIHKDIIYTSLQNKKYFDVNKLLLAISEGLKPFVFRGEVYKSFTECCRTFNFNPSTIYSYTEKGLPKADALEKALAKQFVFNGVNYGTVKNACKELGINYGVICSYCNRKKCNYETAIAYYLSEGKQSMKNSFVFRGKEYPSLRSVQIAYNLSTNTNYRRYAKEHNITIQEALEHYLALQEEKETFAYNGITYPTAKEMYQALGIKEQTVSRYIRIYGCTRTEAIDKALEKQKGFVFRGKMYKNFTKCCEKHNIRTSAVHYYKTRNALNSLQEAIECTLINQQSKQNQALQMQETEGELDYE